MIWGGPGWTEDELDPEYLMQQEVEDARPDALLEALTAALLDELRKPETFGPDETSDEALASDLAKRALSVLAPALDEALVNARPVHWSDDRWDGWCRARSMMNRSGCCCVFGDDDETVIRICSAHKDQLAEARREERRRCAEVAENWRPDGWVAVERSTALQIAVAIRSLKDPA